MIDIYTQLDEKVAKLDVNYKERDRLTKENDKLRASIEPGKLTAIKEAESKSKLKMNAEALVILEERNQVLYLTEDNIFELNQALSNEAHTELQGSFSDTVDALKQVKSKVDAYINEAETVYREKEQKKNAYSPYTDPEKSIYTKKVHPDDNDLTYIQCKLRNQLNNL